MATEGSVNTEFNVNFTLDQAPLSGANQSVYFYSEDPSLEIMSLQTKYDLNKDNYTSENNYITVKGNAAGTPYLKYYMKGDYTCETKNGNIPINILAGSFGQYYFPKFTDDSSSAEANIYDIVSLSASSTFYVFGNFYSVARNLNGFAKLNSDYIDVDITTTGIDFSNGINDYIGTKIINDAGNGFYGIGVISQDGGLTYKGPILHWNENGSFDTNFNSPTFHYRHWTGTYYNFVPCSVSGAAYGIKYFGDSVNDIYQPDFSYIPTYNPDTSATNFYTTSWEWMYQTPIGRSYYIQDIAVDDQYVYVVGTFSLVNNQNRIGFVRLNKTTGEVTPIQPINLNGYARLINVDTNYIYISSCEVTTEPNSTYEHLRNFNKVNNVERHGIAAVSKSATAATSGYVSEWRWDIPTGGTPIYESTNVKITQMLPTSNGVYILGNFDGNVQLTKTTAPTAQLLARRSYGFALVHPDNWNTENISANLLPWNPKIYSNFSTTTRLDSIYEDTTNNCVYLGGYFNYLGNSTAYPSDPSNIVRKGLCKYANISTYTGTLTADLDSTWNPNLTNALTFPITCIKKVGNKILTSYGSLTESGSGTLLKDFRTLFRINNTVTTSFNPIYPKNIWIETKGTDAYVVSSALYGSAKVTRNNGCAFQYSGNNLYLLPFDPETNNSIIKATYISENNSMYLRGSFTTAKAQTKYYKCFMELSQYGTLLSHTISADGTLPAIYNSSTCNLFGTYNNKGYGVYSTPITSALYLVEMNLTNGLMTKISTQTWNKFTSSQIGSLYNNNISLLDFNDGKVYNYNIDTTTISQPFTLTFTNPTLTVYEKDFFDTEFYFNISSPKTGYNDNELLQLNTGTGYKIYQDESCIYIFGTFTRVESSYNYSEWGTASYDRLGFVKVDKTTGIIQPLDPKISIPGIMYYNQDNNNHSINLAFYDKYLSDIKIINNIMFINGAYKEENNREIKRFYAIDKNTGEELNWSNPYNNNIYDPLINTIVSTTNIINQIDSNKICFCGNILTDIPTSPTSESIPNRVYLYPPIIPVSNYPKSPTKIYKGDLDYVVESVGFLNNISIFPVPYDAIDLAYYKISLPKGNPTDTHAPYTVTISAEGISGGNIEFYNNNTGWSSIWTQVDPSDTEFSIKYTDYDAWTDKFRLVCGVKDALGYEVKTYSSYITPFGVKSGSNSDMYQSSLATYNNVLCSKVIENGLTGLSNYYINDYVSVGTNGYFVITITNNVLYLNSFSAPLYIEFTSPNLTISSPDSSSFRIIQTDKYGQNFNTLPDYTLEGKYLRLSYYSFATDGLHSVSYTIYRDVNRNPATDPIVQTGTFYVTLQNTTDSETIPDYSSSWTYDTYSENNQFSISVFSAPASYYNVIVSFGLLQTDEYCSSYCQLSVTSPYGTTATRYLPDNWSQAYSFTFTEFQFDPYVTGSWIIKFTDMLSDGISNFIANNGRIYFKSSM